MLKDFTLKLVLRFEIRAREICETFIYKHSETIEYIKNLQNSGANNLRILGIKKAKFSG